MDSRTDPQSSPARRLAFGVASFAAGLAAALVFHFMLYRLSIPLKPFIYVVF
jgi:hypothetical protein